MYMLALFSGIKTSWVYIFMGKNGTENKFIPGTVRTLTFIRVARSCVCLQPESRFFLANLSYVFIIILWGIKLYYFGFYTRR